MDFIHNSYTAKLYSCSQAISLFYKRTLGYSTEKQLPNNNKFKFNKFEFKNNEANSCG